MPINSLVDSIGKSLLTSNNDPGLSGPIFSYPGSYQGPFATTPVDTSGNVYGPAAGTAPAAAATGPTAAQIQAAKDAQTARAIEAGFGGVIGTYDNRLADIPNQINDAGQVVNNQANSQQSSIDSAYGRGNANLQYARDTLGESTKRSISKLSAAIRQSFSSYDTIIGAGGGGDSSATDQLSYALQKVNAQNRSDIYQNEQDNQGQIALKQGDLDAQHSDQLQQLNTWKSNQIIAIGQQFKALQQQIETAKAGANKDKLLALAALNTDAVNQAIAAVSGVEATHQQGMAAIKASLAGLQAPGNAAALSSTTYAPTAAPAAAIPALQTGGGAAAGGSGDSFAAVPYYKRLAAGVA